MEKFRTIETGTGAKFLLGRDAESNDSLVAKFRGKTNYILHTKAPGSPFCVIEKSVFAGDVYAAGVVCARYSQDWRDNKRDVVVDVFTGKDVAKPKGSKTGSWIVKKAKSIKIKKEDILEIIK